jgi:hypothetical protein
MTLSPGRSRGADAGCFCGLNTQHDPWRASAFAWRPCGHQKTLQRQRPIEADTIDRCKAWLAALPPATVTPCALPEREQRIAELEQEIDRLQRTEEASHKIDVVVALGLPRSSDEAGIMLVERRGRVIAVELGPTGGARRSPKVQRKAAAFARWHEPSRRSGLDTLGSG